MQSRAQNVFAKNAGTRSAFAPRVSILEQGVSNVAKVAMVIKRRTGKKVYKAAAKACKRAVELGGNDSEIMIDALNLQGVCKFRLGSLIKAVGLL